MTFEQKRTRWAQMMMADPRLDREAKLIGLYIGGLSTEENLEVELSDDDDIVRGVATTPLTVIAARVGLPASVFAD